MYVFCLSSRRRHRRCLSDWSSDVCSSDLPHRPVRAAKARSTRPGSTIPTSPFVSTASPHASPTAASHPMDRDRKSVVLGKSVDLGGLRIIKKIIEINSTLETTHVANHLCP